MEEDVEKGRMLDLVVAEMIDLHVKMNCLHLLVLVEVLLMLGQ
jgi:hypothetical protein